ncbi:MAG: zf-HC2 domain-containing protein [Rhodocyclales bacterium]|nr:zf-HC2 domain-containing protein [Rhodocyclales bacterium]
MAEHRPDSEALSAWLDGELDDAARQRVDEHLADCPTCAAEAIALRELSAGFAAMRGETLGYDLAGVIEGRLAAAPPPPSPTASREAPRWRAWLPATVGAAASLALGIGLGSALLGGAAGNAGNAAQPTLVSAMRVFDPMPPGSVCLGADTCYAKGTLK